jgi:hypothetical protein
MALPPHLSSHDLAALSAYSHKPKKAGSSGLSRFVGAIAARLGATAPAKG